MCFSELKLLKFFTATLCFLMFLSPFGISGWNSVAAQGSWNDTMLTDRIVAWVDNEVLTLSELEEAFVRFQNDGLLDAGPPTERALRRALDIWVDETLIIIDAGNVEPPTEMIETRIEKLIARLDKSHDLEKILKQADQTRDDLREQMRTRLKRDWVVSRAVDQRISIEPEDVEEFRAKRQSLGLPVERYRLAQLFFPLADANVVHAGKTLQRKREHLEDLTHQVRLEVERRREFLKVAREAVQRYASMNPQAGSMGSVEPGELMPELLLAVVDLKPGQTSLPVRSARGIHLMYLEGKTTSRQLLYVQRYKQEKLKLASELRGSHSVQTAETLLGSI